jgi:hypothetical protein
LDPETVVKISAIGKLCFAIIPNYISKSTHKAIEKITNRRMPLKIPQGGCESCRDGEVWWREKSDTPGSLGDHLSVPMKKKIVVLVILDNPVNASNDWYFELLFKILGFMTPEC